MNSPRYTVLRGRMWHSERQRIVVLEFPSTEEAESWDAAGQPINLVPLEKAS